MKKVIEIYFDETKGQPVFVTDDGKTYEPKEYPTGNCVMLRWSNHEDDVQSLAKTILDISRLREQTNE